KNLSFAEGEFAIHRKVLLEELVIDGKRIQVYEGVFASSEKDILDEFVAVGLLREISINKGQYYQLSHDKLIAPALRDLLKLQVNEERKKQEALRVERRKRKAKTILIYSFFPVAILLILLWIFLPRSIQRSQNKAVQDSYLVGVSTARKSNPTLAFHLIST